MNKRMILVALLLSMLLPLQTVRADPITEVIKAAITKIIKAMDLAVQRAQNEVLRLQNMQKAIETEMAKLKLSEIHDWAKKQHDIFNGYYEELKTVRTVIAHYHKVKDLVNAQKTLVNEYRTAYRLLTQDKHFTARRWQYITGVYTGLLSQCSRNVDHVMLIVKSFSLQMSDAARLQMIDEATDEINSITNNLRRFTRENIALSIETARDAQEQQTIKSYYGIP